MGNGLCPPSKTQEMVLQEPSELRQLPRRFGSDGLLDCGFDYRWVSCAQHSNTNSHEDHPHQSSSYLEEPVDHHPLETISCWNCTTRLFHIDSNTMIHSQNRKQYISDGPFFDKISACCQEIAQQRLQEQHGLKWVDIDDGGAPVQALTTTTGPNNIFPNKQERRPTLMIITGRGKSRAGILSVRELIVSGLERGSVLYHVVQAQSNGWDVILLDPNAHSLHDGLSIVHRSLTFFFQEKGRQHEEQGDKSCAHCPPLYILSHSAAGGYLVRYLHKGPARQTLLSNIISLVFTDSTHNLQWIQDDSNLVQFLQSPSHALYIRNCSEHPSDTFANTKDKKAGEVQDQGNMFWKRRFGDIRTVWAGTTDHSAMCWVARRVIWNFFDPNKEGAKKLL